MPSRQILRSTRTSSSGKLASILITAVAVAVALGTASTAVAGSETVPSFPHPLSALSNNAQDDIRTQDTDGDGLIDRDEIQRYGTNPARPDSDRDGLGDGEEVRLGTHPLNADSDGDGLIDGEEVRLGTDPLNADTDGDGLIDGAEIAFSADPFTADSDGDGLSDGQEVQDLGSSPVHIDSDGDGMLDGDEITLYGTNPAKPDAHLVFSTQPNGHKAQLPATAGASASGKPLRVSAVSEPATVARIPLVTTTAAPVVFALD
jgi:hypothetical protein